MLTLVFILLPILISDIINPVLLAGMIYGLGSQHPFVNTWIISLSFFLSYLAAGLLIAVGLEQLTEILQLTKDFDYTLEFILALLLLYFAWRMYSTENQYPEQDLPHKKRMSQRDALLLGLQINIVGLPFALPYLAAIDQILKANLPALTSFLFLLLYNLLYILPFTSLIFIRWYYKRESDSIFQSINKGVDHFTQKYLPVIFLILGLILIEDCVSYFLGYREYSFLSLTYSIPFQYKIDDIVRWDP
ncbi:MAG: GAP family protein [Pseudobdellovibrionaceae bacterium]